MEGEFEPLWTTRQVCAYLGISVKTLYDWRTRKYGPKGHRMGKHLRFRREDVESWLELETEAA